MRPRDRRGRTGRTLLVGTLVSFALVAGARHALLRGEYLPFPEDARDPREARIVVTEPRVD